MGLNSNDRDRGAMLVLTLLLTVVLSVIVMAIAVYTATGLRTSRVATDRNESNAAASAALTWTVEELAAKRIYPSDCTGGAIAVPAGVAPDAETVGISCSQTTDINGNPTVHLTSTAKYAGGSERVIEALVQVPDGLYDAVIAEWDAIDQIDVSTSTPSATTTTVPSGPTTTVPTGSTTTTTVAPTTTTTTTLPPSLTCDFEVTFASGGIGQGELTIHNATSGRVRGWSVAIAHLGTDIDLFTASAESSDGTHYRASNANSNKNLNANSSTNVSSAVISGSDVETGQTYSCEVTSFG